ncbi:type VI secretion system-associated protein VasI [Marinobacter sp. CHS3-4]|uniref:type VI secretion system-associated protein VasI n=1 Tax=Marinobacter sp. CHS3-4 TaxID=3045174 RepID=UPI0024B509C5|nr:type VI secretion system-associated protein VasI [Marinobacter sp. CHS3-4]MDI9243992.1 type VI secretion system-associated protein VasI [Marinobacter sp. CHS3-4]
MRVITKNQFFMAVAAAVFCSVMIPGVALGEISKQLEAAEKCTSEVQRLQRLACFDDVFGTPIIIAMTEAMSGQQPERWRQAFAQEQRRQPGDGPMYRNTGHISGHLMTLSALGSTPPRPLLTIQCHNNITELSLMLPDEIDDERLTMDFGQGQQMWRVRDEGYVVSGGRGLPAIRTILDMSGEQSVTLASSNSRVDGLVFDLKDFGHTLKPLREACGW